MEMKLQYFAEGGTEGGEPTEPKEPKEPKNGEGGTEPKEPKEPKSKTYSQSELDKLLADKKAKWQKEADDAKKLAKMNAEQKAQYQLEKAQKAAEESKKELAKYQMQDTARDMAKDAGMELSHDDIQHVVTADADTTKANIDWLASYTNKLKKAMKSELLKGNPPKTKGTNIKNNGESLGAKLAKKTAKKPNPYFK